MTGRRAALIPSIVLFVVTAIYFATAFKYSPATREVPVAVAGVTMILLIVDMLSQGPGRVSKILRRAFGGGAARRPGDGGESAPVRQGVLALAWIVGFTALAVALGFYLAIPIYVFCYLHLYARKRLTASATIAIALTGILYVVFQLLLGYEIFRGLIFGGYM